LLAEGKRLKPNNQRSGGPFQTRRRRKVPEFEIRKLPDEEGFDQRLEEYVALQKAADAGFAAAKEWDETLEYIPHVRWTEFARACISTYLRTLADFQGETS
jgi:hypothetical protein